MDSRKESVWWWGRGGAIRGGPRPLGRSRANDAPAVGQMRFRSSNRTHQNQHSPPKPQAPRQSHKLPRQSHKLPRQIDTAFASRALETSEITVPCETSGISVVMLYRTLPRMVTPES